MRFTWKCLFLAALVVYVVGDVLLMYAATGGHYGLYGGIRSNIQNENFWIVVILALAAGAFAYYLCQSTRECFTLKKDQEDE
jgi:hypothetical protein